MENIIVNYWAVLVATFAAMVIGWIWYTPGVFGNAWMKVANVDREKMQKGHTPMLLMVVVAFITAYVMAHFVAIIGANTIGDAIQLGFWVWLGFVGTSAMNSVIFEQKPMKWYYITAGYQLVSLCAMATILAIW